MTTRGLVLSFFCTLIFAAPACGGDEGTDPGVRLCEGMADGAACGDPRTGGICVAGACGASRCGDGYVDAVAGEQCEDGNPQAGDGCEPGDCSYSCESDSDCDDGNPCTGEETCGTASHRCAFGTPAAGVIACTQGSGESGVCRGSECVSEGCGDGVVDATTEECDDGDELDGNGCDADCTFSCNVPADCNDGDMCNGTEGCSDHVCMPGTPLVCADDSSDCTVTVCVPETGCGHELIDEDEDGHAPDTLGVCGDDCNDDDDLVHAGAVEICGDGIDNNCTGGTSDEAVIVWYADCDNDGYAPLGATTRMACDKPGTSAALTGCATNAGNWTPRNPATLSLRDCDDDHRDARPNQRTAQVGLVPATGTGDWNCDGVARQTIDPPCLNPPCLFILCSSCPTEQGGWSGVNEVACGSSGVFEYCGDENTNNLCLNDRFRAQECL